MKILREPNFLPAKCPCCGTVFQVEQGDEINSRYGKLGTGEIYCDGLEAECPICHFDEVPLKSDGMIQRY